MPAEKRRPAAKTPGRKRGPKPKPRLTVVREGNPGHSTKAELEAGIELPPSTPFEPDWLEVMAGDDAEDELGRRYAKAEWDRVVPVLDAVGVLASIDQALVVDHCLTVGRVVMCERDISRKGISVKGERGFQKNPSVTAAAQYRAHLRYTQSVLGLTPSSRASLRSKGAAGEDNSSPFDV